MYREKELEITTTTHHKCLPRWRQKIDDARLKGYFSEDDKAEAQRWDVCAVGEAFQKYPKIRHLGGYNCGRPEDDDLYYLGDVFATAIAQDKFDIAQALLTQIEHRLAEIL